MGIQVGTAPDSWGVWFPHDEWQVPWSRYLDEAAAAGYRWTELGPYGYLPTNTAELGCQLSQRGLGVTGTFAMGHLEKREAWPALQQQIIGACESVTALGGHFLVLIDDTYTDLFTGAKLLVPKLTSDEWKCLIDNVHAAADIVCDKYKLTLVFHPHAETHVEYTEQIECLLESTDPSRVSLCLDTGHYAYRNGDPIDFLRKHRERIPYMHIKNVDATVLHRVRIEQIPFAKAVSMGVFCEPEKGVVNFPSLCKVLNEIKFEGWVTVEQDMYPTEFDKPLPIASRTREYLRVIGLG